MVNRGEDNPARLFAAAWEAATGVVAEWAEQTAAVTKEAFQKLTTDPAVRAVLESWRVALVWGRQDCDCLCGRWHPDDSGVCDNRAVITRRLVTGPDGEVDVRLCAPCAVAQGVAEMTGNPPSG
jgi:hypothetical protein